MMEPIKILSSSRPNAVVQDQQEHHFSSYDVLQAYQEVAKHYVHDSLFSSYIHKVQPDCNHLWIFKKQLCISLALSGIPPFPCTCSFWV